MDQLRAFTAVLDRHPQQTLPSISDNVRRSEDLCDGCVELLTEVSRLSYVPGELKQKSVCDIMSEVVQELCGPETHSSEARTVL